MKDISRKKNTTKLIKGGLRTVENEREAKVLEVQISSCGRIIRNVL